MITKRLIYRRIITTISLTQLTFFFVYSEELNPYSFRHDYYKMPVQNEIQEQALLKYKLNWKKPEIVLPYPAEVTDREGNKTIYHKGGEKLFISRDGDITYFANNTKTHTKKILSDGSLYLYRKYTGGSPLREIKNEFGETVGWEEYGLDGKLLMRYDALMRPLYKYEYENDWQYWEYDFVNNIWKKYEKEMPVEERIGSKDGPLVAYWIKGEFFGKTGLWRIEKGWDGEKITDLFYTLYDEFGKEWYEVYHKDGYLTKRGIWRNHRLIREEDLTKFSYRNYNDFGVEEEKYIENHMNTAIWRYEYKGSKIVRAIRDYPDMDFYDVRIYDDAQNIDKVVRIDKKTQEVLCILEDRIYFSEVKGLSKEEIKELFDLNEELASSLYEWIQEMKKEGKADAGLFGIFEPTSYTLTLYDKNNNPSITINTFSH